MEKSKKRNDRYVCAAINFNIISRKSKSCRGYWMGMPPADFLGKIADPCF